MTASRKSDDRTVDADHDSCMTAGLLRDIIADLEAEVFAGRDIIDTLFLGSRSGRYFEARDKNENRS
jgi:hypothetical protein